MNNYYQTLNDRRALWASIVGAKKGGPPIPWTFELVVNDTGVPAQLSSNDDCGDICYAEDKGKWVAVGNQGAIYSNDGVDWFNVVLPDYNLQCIKIVYGDGIFVSITKLYNSNGYPRVIKSTDGINWSLHIISVAMWENIVDIKYANGVFVAISSNGAYYSYDGETWTSSGLWGSSSWVSIAYNEYDNNSGYGFMVLGSDGYIKNSVNGQNNWMDFDNLPIGNYGDYKCLVAGVDENFNMRLASGGIDNILYVYENGLWTQTTDPYLSGETWEYMDISTEYPYKIRALSTTSSNITIEYNNDRSTWVSTGAPNTHQNQTLRYINGNFYTIGSSTNYVISYGSEWGSYWISISSVIPRRWGNNSVVYGDGSFISIQSGYDGKLLGKSIDGINWEFNNVHYNSWNSLAYGNGTFVAVASGGANRVMTSTDDGITWTLRTASQANQWQSVAYGNGVFVAVAQSGTNRIMRSTDNGLTWSSVVSPEANQWYSVAYGNGVWVAVSANGTNRIMRSTDNGLNWSSIASPEQSDWSSVAYGDGTFVAVANGGINSVMTSTDDGITWTSRTTPGTNQWQSVAYGNGVFVAVSIGGTNTTMTSPDGITWTSYPSTYVGNSIAYGGGRFVIVGNSLPQYSLL